ncbi:MAG: phage major capsid protein [bacterium]|nr:phage major capsid protein [bacterium]
MDRWEQLQQLIAAAAALLETIRELPAEEVTAEHHAEVDRIYAEAAEIRAEIDRERSIHQLETVAAARQELTAVGQWALASGNLGGLRPAPTGGPEAEEPFVRIHRYAQAIMDADGQTGDMSFTVDMEGARLQSILLRAGMTPTELAVHAQRGTLASMLGELRGPAPEGEDELQRALVQATLTTTVLTPTLFATTLYDYMEYLGGLRQAGSMYTPLTRGNKITFWANRGHAAAQAAAAQGTAVPDAEDTYSSYDVETATYGGKAFLSRELIEDGGVAGLVNVIGSDVGRVAARSAEAAYHLKALEAPADAGDVANHYARTIATADSSAGDPKLPVPTIGTESTYTQPRETLTDLLFELDESYIMGNATWLMPKSIYKTITQVFIPNIGYPYQASAVDGPRYQIEAHPVSLDAFFPAIPAVSGGGSDYGVAAMGVGNWMDAFHIVDVGGIRVDMSSEYRFAERLVTVMGWIRTGGAIRDPRAAKLWCAKTKT